MSWRRRFELWLRDLLARCDYCSLRLPLVGADRMSWHLVDDLAPEHGPRWICPFCWCAIHHA